VQGSARGEARVDHRLLRAAGDEPRDSERAADLDVRDHELGSVPRHARVIPGEPGETAAGRVEPRSHEEVVAAGDDLRLGQSIRRKPDELVAHLARLVTLAHAKDRRAVRGHAAVGVSQRVRLCRLGCDRMRLRAGTVDAVEPAVVELGEERRVAVEPHCSAAVFVHARACVRARRRHVDELAVGPCLDDGRAAALVRPDLGPAQ